MWVAIDRGECYGIARHDSEIKTAIDRNAVGGQAFPPVGLRPLAWTYTDVDLLTPATSTRCPNFQAWRTARDNLYEDIMHKAWNQEKGFFAQSYEDKVRSGFQT